MKIDEFFHRFEWFRRLKTKLNYTGIFKGINAVKIMQEGLAGLSCFLQNSFGMLFHRQWVEQVNIMLASKFVLLFQGDFLFPITILGFRYCLSLIPLRLWIVYVLGLPVFSICITSSRDSSIMDYFKRFISSSEISSAKNFTISSWYPLFSSYILY